MTVYNPKWDLSTIPDEELASERGRRNRARMKPAVKLAPCVHCGVMLTATQRRKRCFNCEKSQASRTNERRSA